MNLKVLTILFVALFSAGLGRAGDAVDAAVVESYSSAAMDLDLLDQTLRAVAGKDANIVVDRRQHRVVVIADAETHRKIAAIMKETGAPPENVRVEVRIRRATDTSESGGRIRLSPAMRYQSTWTRMDATQTLLVASGRSGILRVGKSVPNLEWFESYGWHSRSVDYRVVWQEVGSFLRVEPTVIDDGPQIRLELTPVLRGRVEGRPHEIAFVEASTEVVVNDGQMVSLASLDEHQDFMSHFLVGMERGRETHALEVELTPRRVGVDGSGAAPMAGTLRRNR